MSLTVKFRVSGRVQGVFFRISTKQQADTAGLSGWVRNCDDGDVEGMASGTAAQLDAFSRWLAEGPTSARVEELQINECDYQSFAGFVVR